LTPSLQYFNNSKNYGNIKEFNPILPSIDKLHVSFKDFNGNLYDFNGIEHFLTFAIRYNNISS